MKEQQATLFNTLRQGKRVVIEGRELLVERVRMTLTTRGAIVRTAEIQELGTITSAARIQEVRAA